MTGQNAQAALNQTLSQASNGAVLYTRSVSACHFDQFLGQFTSAHSTALYTANVFSLVVPQVWYWVSSRLPSPSAAYWESACANAGHTEFR